MSKYILPKKIPSYLTEFLGFVHQNSEETVQNTLDVVPLCEKHWAAYQITGKQSKKRSKKHVPENVNDIIASALELSQEAIRKVQAGQGEVGPHVIGALNAFISTLTQGPMGSTGQQTSWNKNIIFLVKQSSYYTITDRLRFQCKIELVKTNPLLSLHAKRYVLIPLLGSQ